MFGDDSDDDDDSDSDSSSDWFDLNRKLSIYLYICISEIIKSKILQKFYFKVFQYRYYKNLYNLVTNKADRYF